MTPKPIVTVFTDGSCKPNPGVGGWAAILRYGPHEKVLTGGDPDTTNNRMEVTAAIRALETLKVPCQVGIMTDSEYLSNGWVWMDQWKMHDWLRADGGDVKNKDLWTALQQAAAPHEISFHWIKGHAGHPENERCDQLAKGERTAIALGK
jgi:ribonuclease HI